METSAPLRLEYDRLVQRIRSARELLRSVTHPIHRDALLRELAVDTQKLTNLVLGSVRLKEPASSA